jgi:hypothetical protein
MHRRRRSELQLPIPTRGDAGNGGNNGGVSLLGAEQRSGSSSSAATITTLTKPFMVRCPITKKHSWFVNQFQPSTLCSCQTCMFSYAFKCPILHVFLRFFIPILNYEYYSYISNLFYSVLFSFKPRCNIPY